MPTEILCKPDHFPSKYKRKKVGVIFIETQHIIKSAELVNEWCTLISVVGGGAHYQ